MAGQPIAANKGPACIAAVALDSPHELKGPWFRQSTTNMSSITVLPGQQQFATGGFRSPCCAVLCCASFHNEHPRTVQGCACTEVMFTFPCDFMPAGMCLVHVQWCAIEPVQQLKLRKVHASSCMPACCVHIALCKVNKQAQADTSRLDTQHLPAWQCWLQFMSDVGMRAVFICAKCMLVSWVSMKVNIAGNAVRCCPTLRCCPA